MNPEFWLERWQKSETGFHQQDINSHLQHFWQALNPAKNSAVFVPLCGKSRDMLWLQGQGHTVLGAEISPIAVTEFFTENGLVADAIEHKRHTRWESGGLTIFQGDFFQLTPEDVQAVSGVFDRASLIALPPELRQDYARQLIRILPANAGILLVTLEYDQNLMGGPPFSVGESEIRELYGQCYEIRLLFAQDALDENPQFRSRGYRPCKKQFIY